MKLLVSGDFDTHRLGSAIATRFRNRTGVPLFYLFAISWLSSLEIVKQIRKAGKDRKAARGETAWRSQRPLFISPAVAWWYRR